MKAIIALFVLFILVVIAVRLWHGSPSEKAPQIIDDRFTYPTNEPVSSSRDFTYATKQEIDHQVEVLKPKLTYLTVEPSKLSLRNNDLTESQDTPQAQYVVSIQNK